MSTAESFGARPAPNAHPISTDAAASGARLHQFSGEPKRWAIGGGVLLSPPAAVRRNAASRLVHAIEVEQIEVKERRSAILAEVSDGPLAIDDPFD